MDEHPDKNEKYHLAQEKIIAGRGRPRTVFPRTGVTAARERQVQWVPALSHLWDGQA